MNKTGDKRINMETYVPEVYIFDRWISMEWVRDVKSVYILDIYQILAKEFGEKWVEKAKECIQKLDC
jgi:hypothetical protein